VDPRAGLDDVEKRKFLTLLGLSHPSLVQPVASRYTDYAIPAPLLSRENLNFPFCNLPSAGSKMKPQSYRAPQGAVMDGYGDYQVKRKRL
jgi:hypothetical protein